MQAVVNMKGTTPLVMHNPRLADPLYELTKAIKALTSQKRTDEIDAQIAELEFKGSLYINDQGPFIAAEALKKTWVCGARLKKLGTAVERGVTMLQVEYPLLYTGPRTPDELWNDRRFVWRTMAVVKSSGGRVIRTRPQFPEWAVKAEIDVDPEMINLKDFARVIGDSGLYIGCLEARKIGRGKFTATVETNGAGTKKSA